MKPALIASLALAAQILATPADAQASKSFGAWTAGCDNTRACVAVGMAADGAMVGASIIVRRDGGPATTPAARLFAQFDLGKDKPGPVALTFDEPGFEAALPTNAVLNGEGEANIPLALNDGLIAALRKAKKLTITRKDASADADATLEVSLAGAVAALLWIDDQQGRVRNQTAIISKGDGAASRVAAPVRAPVVARAKGKARELKGAAPAAVVAAWKKACEEWDSGQGEKSGYDLGGGQSLWSMPCSNGAYNYISAWFLASRGGAPKLLAFETIRDGKLVLDSDGVTNGDFDPGTMTMDFFNKGRGLGDCGDAGKYVWTGSAFRLVEFSAMGECRGVTLENWPRLWRAEVK